MTSIDLLSVITLAQAETPQLGVPGVSDPASTPADPNAAGGAGQAPASPGFGSLWIWMIPIGLLVFMMMTSGKQAKKEKIKREEMISSLRKHDRVQTTGGIIGAVSEIRGDEVVVRVDEDTHTRIRFNKAAIQQVLSSPSGGSGSESELDEAEMSAQV